MVVDVRMLTMPGVSEGCLYQSALLQTATVDGWCHE
jgi:hypothetical protein